MINKCIILVKLEQENTWKDNLVFPHQLIKYLLCKTRIHHVFIYFRMQHPLRGGFARQVQQHPHLWCHFLQFQLPRVKRSLKTVSGRIPPYFISPHRHGIISPHYRKNCEYSTINTFCQRETIHIHLFKVYCYNCCILLLAMCQICMLNFIIGIYK